MPEGSPDLAARQAALVAALAGRGEPPPGFDASRLAAATASLASKRRAAVARAWPRLAQALGTELAPRFAAYAAAHPLPATGGPLADGRQFFDQLPNPAALPDQAQLERLAAELHLRQGPCLRARRLPETRRLVVALRLPLLGERWFGVRLGLG